MSERTGTGARVFGVVNLLAALVFLVGALVQLNDADPWRWIIIYGSHNIQAALPEMMSFAREINRRT